MPPKTRKTLRDARDVAPPVANTISLSLLRLPAVEAKVGLKRSAIYRLMAENDFPKPIRLPPRAVGWIAAEIDAWIAVRAAAR